jgi:inosine-uridine nucleoside N-ribohydrolase
MKVHFDLETGDPDDLMTLALLATHPRVELVACTVFPGGLDQVGLARTVLQRCGRPNVLVGATPKLDGKSRVGPFYERWLGKIELQDPDCSATEALSYSAAQNCRLITGAPLTNIARWQEATKDFIQNWTCQGGFAGDSVMPEELRLPKFAGMETCPTFNLNGDPKAALMLLDQNLHRMGYVDMVAKNVCHGFWFGPDEVASLPRGAHPGLDLLIQGMHTLMVNKPEGKALHDILAAMMAIRPELGQWRSGFPYRESGGWGFNKVPGVSTRILIAADKPAVIEAMAG